MILEEDDTRVSVFPFRLAASEIYYAGAIQSRIGAGLRELYQQLQEEPLPDRLVDLARELERVLEERSHGG